MWYQNNQPTVAAPNENFRTKCVIGIDRDGVINEDLFHLSLPAVLQYMD